MKISVIQTNSVNDLEANLGQARELVAAAVAGDRPDMVVLPEMFAFMGSSIADRHANAEPLPNGTGGGGRRSDSETRPGLGPEAALGCFG